MITPDYFIKFTNNLSTKEFIETDMPLALVVSINLKTKEILIDYYKTEEEASIFMEEAKKEMPSFLSLYKANPAMIKKRREKYKYNISNNM